MVFIVRTMRKFADVLLINSSGLLQVCKVNMFELDHMTDVDYGAAQAKKMKASLRRIARKPGTTKRARLALQEILK